jgi:hypothetical protein
LRLVGSGARFIGACNLDLALKLGYQFGLCLDMAALAFDYILTQLQLENVQKDLEEIQAQIAEIEHKYGFNLKA